MFTTNTVTTSYNNEVAIIQGKDYMPIPEASRSQMCSFLMLAHKKHTISLTENIMQGID